jgi:acetyl-CoA acetyltransferase
MRDKTAIVGLGWTPYFKRGRSLPQTLDELAEKAILAAVKDAGLKIADVDGFAYFGGGFDTPVLCEALGVPEVRYSTCITGTGGGSAGIVGLAASAILSGMAETVVCVGGIQQAYQRYGTLLAAYPPTPENAFFTCAGLIAPGHLFALLARRHMHLYGTTREQFGEVAVSTRMNAARHPDAIMREPLTLEQYMQAPMIADPHCIYDFCLESDGVVALIVTSAERAKDMRQKPVYVMACLHGGSREWGRSLYWMNMPDDVFASSGHAPIAKRLYDMAGVGPSDIDVAELFDHFSSQVIMQLEDYGFCRKGEGGPFVQSGAIRFDGGTIPVNTHGGHLSSAYLWGMTHLREAVEQLRGTAVNQVRESKVALVTGGPASVPVSGLIVRN